MRFTMRFPYFARTTLEDCSLGSCPVRGASDHPPDVPNAMTSAEADQFIISATRTLRRWQSEIDGLSGEPKAEATAARDTVLGTLMEIADEFPGKRAKIDAIARTYRYGVWAAGGPPCHS